MRKKSLHKRAASIVLHEGSRIAQGMPPGEMYDWARTVLDLEGRLDRVRALIPANPELIEAGYAVPAEDILAALKGA